ncbi:hypothetical protein M9H77_06180 [Catharanthus roseus]|uniref:Uncharacterized protein n=1 Tax=Catharanthus roseus TaxID=4058 RepID=A0ACC0BRC8_CATRO|nr:hypothetical protein M9H77_06180 [Catharanthus roseus]
MLQSDLSTPHTRCYFLNFPSEIQVANKAHLRFLEFNYIALKIDHSGDSHDSFDRKHWIIFPNGNFYGIKAFCDISPIDNNMVEESHVRSIKKDAYYLASSDGPGRIITTVS